MNKLLKLLQLSQEDVWLQLYQTYHTRITQVSLGDYIYVENPKDGLRPLIVCHIDTCNKGGVAYSDLKVIEGVISLKNTSGYTCLGGDDRVGLWACMRLLDNNQDCDILFTCNEEVGGLGVKEFASRLPKNNWSCVLEIDRKGTQHIATYGYDNDELEAIIGLPVQRGSYTDLCDICDSLYIAGYNIACGYYNQHTTNETIVMDEVIWCYDKVVSLIPLLKDKVYTTEPTYKKYSYNKYDEWDALFEDRYKIDDTKYCQWCGAYCGEDELDEHSICTDCYNYDREHIETYLSTGVYSL